MATYPGKIDVEAIDWHKSARSANPNDNCVEVGALDDGWVAMRDSKNPHGPVLTFNRDEWDAFVKGVHAGEFD